jgi:zinc protease
MRSSTHRTILPALVTVSLALTLVAAGPSAVPSIAQQVATTVDQIHFPPLREFEIPQPERHVLDNGMVVLLMEDHEMPLVEATALIHTGSRLEPAEKSGMAQLTGTVLRTGGTTTRTGDELDDFLESKAASIETGIGSQSGRAFMSSLKEDFPEVLEVFADVLRNPVFDPEKIEVAKTSVEASIARQNDNPQQILFREFNQIIYGSDSPYTQRPTYASVANVSRDDLIAWHRKYYHPNRVILGLVGDFDSDEALNLVEEVFGDWTKGPPLEAVDTPYDTNPKPGIFYVEKNDMTQSDIAMGHIGIRRDNPDYYAVQVMNQVLSGSFASRLFSRVRSKEGLAYTVFGQVGSQWDHDGITLFGMTTKTGSTGAGIDALLREARNMTSEPPTDDEVKKAKEGILNSFIFRSDSRSEILNQQLTYEYYGYPLDWLSRYQKGIEGVTVPQVRQAAEDFLHPDNFAILVVGPSEGLDKPLSSYGQVTDVDISIPEPETARAEVTEEGTQRASELLAKAVDSMGGALVDTIHSFRATGTAVQKTPQGDMQIQLTSTFVYPGSLRQELKLPFGTVVMVLTPEGGFADTPQGVMDLPESQRENVEKSARRSPLMLLRARNDPDFVATVAGSAEVDGTPVELVQVEQEGDVTTLGIDPTTGRLLQVSYQGTSGMGGAPGEVTQTFSDFREVDGLTYPFSVVGSFNGEQSMSLSIDSIEVDPEIEAAAFTKPASGDTAAE